MLEGSGRGLRQEGHRLAEAHRGLRQVVVTRTERSLSPSAAGRGFSLEQPCRQPRTPKTRRPPRRRSILSVNNIEVIYDHVILVLKGVSLDVPKGGIVALLGANGAGKTTTLKAISNLLHAERGDVTKGSITVRRRRGAGPVAQRTGAARLHPGDGRPPLLRPSHHRGKPAHRRLHAARRPGGDQTRHRPGLFLFPQARRAARVRWPATPPAASSRCARSAAR